MAGCNDLVRFGVEGLDDVLEGGIPRGTLFLVEGRPGSGKTTIALQFLIQGTKQGETCLLVSNAETPRQLHMIAETHGWSLDGIHVTDWKDGGAEEVPGDASDYTLFPEAEVEVGETLSQLFADIERLRPARLVIDTISTIRMLAPTAAFYRRQLRRIRDFLVDNGCTTLLVDDCAVAEKDVRSQTLSDGILELEQSDMQYGGQRRRLRVRKLRASTYVGGAHDFRIKTGGITVFPRLVAAQHTELAPAEPARSGLSKLDDLSGGGLPRGTSTLIIGPAGTGKSTLASLYIQAAAERGERSALCLFDESPTTYIARSTGLGIDLEPAIESGQIVVTHLDPAEYTPGEISHHLFNLVKNEGVRLVAIDTLNGYLQSAAEDPMVLLHLRELLTYLARRQVVSLLILTQHGILGAEMASPIDISFIADNVFLLRYFETAGAIRQALSLVKKRSGNHERTIREMKLSDRGVHLSDPLGRLSGVLSGTPYLTRPPGSREA